MIHFLRRSLAGALIFFSILFYSSSSVKAADPDGFCSVIMRLIYGGPIFPQSLLEYRFRDIKDEKGEIKNRSIEGWSKVYRKLKGHKSRNAFSWLFGVGMENRKDFIVGFLLSSDDRAVAQVAELFRNFVDDPTTVQMKFNRWKIDYLNSQEIYPDRVVEFNEINSSSVVAMERINAGVGLKVSRHGLIFPVSDFDFPTGVGIAGTQISLPKAGLSDVQIAALVKFVINRMPPERRTEVITFRTSTRN